MISERPSHGIFGSGIKVVCQRGSFAKPDPNMSHFTSTPVFSRADVWKCPSKRVDKGWRLSMVKHEKVCVALSLSSHLVPAAVGAVLLLRCLM